MLKRFILNALSSFVGAWLAIVLAGISIVMLLVGMIGNLALSSGTSERVTSRSILKLSLNGEIIETESVNSLNPMAIVQGDLEKPQALNVIVAALKQAANNKDIVALYLDCGNVAASPATLNAIREAVVDFKKSGKPVYAYGDNLSTGTYFVASAADRIYMCPDGELSMKGLGTMSLYMKDLFDKVGVQFQVVKVGTYKSAVEPYIMQEMSEPARAQLDTLFGNMWRYIRKGIASSRKGITPAQIDSLITVRNISFGPASQAVSSGLVDSLIYGRAVAQRFAWVTGQDPEDVNFVSPSTLVAQVPWGQAYSSKNCIAVLYACGEIEDGNPSAIDYQTLVPIITQLADDEKVKGMVLRVNSPGGSAFGSAQIGEALDYFQSKGKPLAVSMGDYAASGGYWISSCADKIFADPLTITGSIGIFGLIPNFSGLASKLGVNPVLVSTTPAANFPNGVKPMDERQLGVLQAYVDRGYEQFVGRVAKGRKMSVQAVKRIAEGRVWDAQSARRIGLVDSLAGLGTAIEWVAKKADIYSKYEIAAYPKYEPGLLEMLPAGKEIKQEVAKAQEPDPDAVLMKYVRKILARNKVQARMIPVIVTLN